MPAITITIYPRRLSLITLLFGISTFLWLTPEDSGWTVIAFGVTGSALAAAHAVFRNFGGRTLSPRMAFIGHIALGAAIGGGAVLMTAFLMIMKTSIHAHLFPDYPAGLLIGIIARLPAWTAAGALIGLAAALVRARR